MSGFMKTVLQKSRPDCSSFSLSLFSFLVVVWSDFEAFRSREIKVRMSDTWINHLTNLCGKNTFE